MIKRLISFLTVLLAVQWVAAQAPSGYYSSTKGTSGRSLKTAMYKVISANYHVVGYDNLYKAYEKTDCRPDGKVWDMYSDITHYDLRKDRAGNYQKEGDCFNREHTFPQSWFNGGSMKSDLFNVYPTDAKINGMRSNYPYGETKGEKFKSHNGWSKLGSCTTKGYSGTVFEPNDEYKGDIARTYFYIATCYENQIAGWGRDMMAHNSYPAFSKWALDMLLRWAKEDPVSQKEIDRNNAVFKIQRNRNPYIDYPGLEQYVWGDKTSVSFDPNNYVPGEGGGEVNPEPTPNPDNQAIFSETFASSQGDFTIEDKVLPQGAQYVWKHSSHEGQSFMKASAYVSQKCLASESWLVSPMIDLTKVTDCTLSFDQAMNHFKGSNGCDVKVKAEGGQWTSVEVSNKPTVDSWDFLTSTVNLKAFANKRIQIAFVYTSTTEIAGTWEIQNVKVSGENGEVNPNPNPEPDKVAVPNFSVASGQVEANTVVTISSTTPGASIHYTVNNGAEVVGVSPVQYTLIEDASISAYATLGDAKSETATAVYTIAQTPVVGSGVFVKISSTTDLTQGCQYLIVCESLNKALAGIKEDVRDQVGVTITDGTIKSDVSVAGKPYALVLGRTNEGYTFYDAATKTYLGLTSKSGNDLESMSTVNGKDGSWTISFSEGNAIITNCTHTNRYIQYNQSSPRFATYTHAMTAVSLYKETVPSAIIYPVLENNGTVDVYSIDGRLLRDDVQKTEAVKGLPRGLYIVGGLKIFVK